jgi:hypothetical protein
MAVVLLFQSEHENVQQQLPQLPVCGPARLQLLAAAITSL